MSENIGIRLLTACNSRLKYRSIFDTNVERHSVSSSAAVAAAATKMLTARHDGNYRLISAAAAAAAVCVHLRTTHMTCD